MPNLLKWSDRSHLSGKISTVIQRQYPEWKIRVEQALLVLLVGENKFYINRGPLSVERAFERHLKKNVRVHLSILQAL